MKCPVCGGRCITPAESLIEGLPGFFSPCNHCKPFFLDKDKPPEDFHIPSPCTCEKRPIDAVFLHIYSILLQEGCIEKSASLKSIGMPLIHPGIPLHVSPFLPKKSLIFLSSVVDESTAQQIYDEVPEIKGVVRDCGRTPGISEITQGTFQKHSLLAGCDVRADVFPTSLSPVVTYKEQSGIHIEFSRGRNEKITTVERTLRKRYPHIFIDACCGSGTLGITAALHATPEVILNDAWSLASYWSAVNLWVNRESLYVDEISFEQSYEDLTSLPVREKPVLVAQAHGSQEINVYHGDWQRLSEVCTQNETVCALDLFKKSEKNKVQQALRFWKEHMNGEVFIP